MLEGICIKCGKIQKFERDSKCIREGCNSTLIMDYGLEYDEPRQRHKKRTIGVARTKCAIRMDNTYKIPKEILVSI